MVIITDSSSGIDIEEAKGLDIEIVPLVITMNGENFIQETPSQIDYFYSKLETTNNLPVTSRPSPENYLKFYDKAESIGEDVLVLTLSHGLSGTYESAMVARNMSS
ncbi:DegV family protein [Facklamia sp. DSM 111018]|uniref:DegV family protein n=1 Tax=Facklamia lactis TaxID=2749967 RepID=A0ABS0LQU2_9LACT|nr:DegV family protein [Facklamia lactis]